MAVPTPRTLKDYFLSCFSPSIATSPVATQVVVPFSGRIVKTYGVSLGTTTGTTAVAVAINGGSAISSAALSIGAGGAGVEVEATVNATGTDATASQVYDGDVISFTPSGGTGSNRRHVHSRYSARSFLMANGNGLTPKEQKALSHTLSKLEAVGSKAFLLGREGREMLLLADKIRSRLVPATPESLLADADRLFGMWEGVPAIETALASMH